MQGKKRAKKTSRWSEQRGKSQAARGGRKGKKYEGEYSRLVFQLITTEGPGAAVRHIFFAIFFFITNIN